MRPQDGRARVAVRGAVVDLRVSTLPASHGEKIVIRVRLAAPDVVAAIGTSTPGIINRRPVLTIVTSKVLSFFRDTFSIDLNFFKTDSNSFFRTLKVAVESIKINCRFLIVL